MPSGGPAARERLPPIARAARLCGSGQLRSTPAPPPPRPPAARSRAAAGSPADAAAGRPRAAVASDRSFFGLGLRLRRDYRSPLSGRITPGFPVETVSGRRLLLLLRDSYHAD